MSQSRLHRLLFRVTALLLMLAIQADALDFLAEDLIECRVAKFKAEMQFDCADPASGEYFELSNLQPAKRLGGPLLLSEGVEFRGQEAPVLHRLALQQQFLGAISRSRQSLFCTYRI